MNSNTAVEFGKAITTLVVALTAVVAAAKGVYEYVPFIWNLLG